LYNTKTNKITGFTPTIQEDVDVVFALSVDPHASRYPYLTPYNGLANNPILFVDPDGRDIIIFYGNNQSYTYGSNEPIPDDEFVKQAVNTINDLINNKPDPFNTIQTISEDKKFRWYIAEGDISRGNEVATIQNPAYSAAFTTWDPKGGVITEKGGKQSPQTQLKHEGGHAYIAYRLSLIYRRAVAMLAGKTEMEQQQISNDALKEINNINSTNNYPIANWDNLEEKYINDKIVTPSLVGTNEGNRNSHDGTFYKTTGPTSIESEDNKPFYEERTGIPFVNNGDN